MEKAVSNISKSMISYLKRARGYKEFLLKETKEFERSKRHLANIMGLDSKEMTQEDVDQAIKYLFPSGLFRPEARPRMRHPDLLYKAQKDAQFDVEGRPHHYLFYTIKPNYFETLSDIAKHIRALDKFEDEQIATGILDPPSDSYFQLRSRTWLDITEMKDKFIEKLTDVDYDYLIRSLEHLSKHPYSANVESFLELYTKPLEGQTKLLDLPEIKEDKETGALYTQMISRKREHDLDVKIILNGSGKIDIEGKNILYFEHPYSRLALYAPLKISGMQDNVDIIARFVRRPERIGESSVAIPIRYALATSLAAFCNEEVRSRLRLAGLLTIDTRRSERKKFGQEGARRKYTWKRR